MTTTTLAFIGIDLLALAILVGALYLPRHGRRDLVAAYVGINVGVLAVTLLLSTASVGAGLGLGLFGVLSIIRLRSSEISQGEIAYFFAALALGLLGGLQTAPIAVVAALMTLVVAALTVADSPRLAARNRHQVINVDRAIAKEGELRAHLEQMLGARIIDLTVQRLDLVNDFTLVDVRYRLHTKAAHSAQRATSQAVQAEDVSTKAVNNAPATLARSPQAPVAAAATTQAASAPTMNAPAFTLATQATAPTQAAQPTRHSLINA